MKGVGGGLYTQSPHSFIDGNDERTALRWENALKSGRAHPRLRSRARTREGLGGARRRAHPAFAQSKSVPLARWRKLGGGGGGGGSAA